MKRVFVLFALLVCMSGISYAYENTYAIIVGINAYYDKPLVGPVNDALAFRDFLLSRKGGSVPAENICLLLDSDATKASIMINAQWLFAKAKKNDRVIFYFSGHGGDGCFMPYGFDGWFDSALSYSDVKSIFRYAKCNTKLMFADACHSGGIKGYDRKKANISSKKDKNIAVMLSCKADEFSYDGTSTMKMGVFTYYLMKGLGGEANTNADKGNKYITIKELFYYVYNHVTTHFSNGDYQQTPQLFGNFDLRLIVGKDINN